MAEAKEPHQHSHTRQQTARPCLRLATPNLGVSALGTATVETQHARGSELSYDFDEDQEVHPLPLGSNAEHLKPLPPLRRHKLVKSVVALFILIGLAAIISWQWPHFSELYRSVAQILVKEHSGQAVPQTASQSSFLDRFPQEQETAATAGMPGSQTAPTAAQRVVLYEEGGLSSDPQGKRYWLSFVADETVSPDQAPTLQCARCENSRTADHHDLVASAKHRPRFAGEPHHRNDI